MAISSCRTLDPYPRWPRFDIDMLCAGCAASIEGPIKDWRINVRVRMVEVEVRQIQQPAIAFNVSCRPEALSPGASAALSGLRVLVSAGVIAFHCLMYWGLLLSPETVHQVGCADLHRLSLMRVTSQPEQRLQPPISYYSCSPTTSCWRRYGKTCWVPTCFWSSQGSGPPFSWSLLSKKSTVQPSMW